MSVPTLPTALVKFGRTRARTPRPAATAHREGGAVRPRLEAALALALLPPTAFGRALPPQNLSGPAHDAQALVTREREATQTPEAAGARAELPKLYRVSGRLYRGGQPRPGGLARLAALGVKTIVNLRGRGAAARAEEEEARALGLRYYNVETPT